MGVSVEHFQCQALSLHVEELCDVEHSLVFFAGHSVEQNVIVWIAEEYDWVYLVEHAVHRRKSAFHLRNRLHQGVNVLPMKNTGKCSWLIFAYSVV